MSHPRSGSSRFFYYVRALNMDDPSAYNENALIKGHKNVSKKDRMCSYHPNISLPKNPPFGIYSVV